MDASDHHSDIFGLPQQDRRHLRISCLNQDFFSDRLMCSRRVVDAVPGEYVVLGRRSDGSVVEREAVAPRDPRRVDWVQQLESWTSATVFVLTARTSSSSPGVRKVFSMKS